MYARQVLTVPLRQKHIHVARTASLRPSLIRSFATHRDHVPSPLLTNVLDQKVRQANREDSVGPFQWGMVQPTIDHGEKVAKWKELSTKGKIMRTTERTTNLTVILLGAGLSALLIYSLTTELFSKNSSTVLYNQACERIKASPRIAEYIQGSLSFHNNPPSAVRPRHRNRHVSYHITKDSQGREHMFLHFYVHGSDSAGAYSDSANERGYFGALAQWTRDKASSVSDLNLEDSLAWSKAYALHVWDRWKRAFRYLSGAPISQLPSQPPLETPEQIPKEKDSWWGAAGLFGSLRRNRERIVERKEGIGRVFMDGEVHAELIQNDEGYFVFQYLFVDIPSSRNRHERVWVQRGPGIS